MNKSALSKLYLPAVFKILTVSSDSTWSDQAGKILEKPFCIMERQKNLPSRIIAP